MKRYLVLVSALLIAGCSSVPVAVKFPDVPADMLSACPDLKPVPETTKLSEVLPTVVDNYSQYYTCKDNVDNWIDWYNSQKKIFDSIK
jgi:hypothetical protein